MSNTANPKGEEIWRLKLREMKAKNEFDDKFNPSTLEFTYAFQMGFKASTPPTESKPDYWKKRCEAAEKIINIITLLQLDNNLDYLYDSILAQKEWQAIKNQTHLQETKNKEQ